MKRLRLSVTVVVLIALIALVGAALTGVIPIGDEVPTDAGPTATPAPTSTELQDTVTPTVTGQAGTAGDETMLFGLLPMWQAAYNGTGTHNYDFNGDGTPATRQCGNCHMGGGSKHSAPLHPIGLSPTDSGAWFFDDNRQIGPNTRLVSQPAGITPKGMSANCGDCHTPTNAAGFANPDTSGRTSDPHSVHTDVIGREGCIRCHSAGGEMFSGAISFRQGNATGATNGISNPINMNRVWDGKFLSSPQEAKYAQDGSVGQGGWNKYKQADSQGAVAQGCGDCHGQYHANGGLAFTFDDSVGSRSGPIALVNDAESFGINSGGTTFTCGDCHVTDAHAVHTNGLVSSRATYNTLTDLNQTITEPGAQGAEYCPECHGQSIAKDFGNHFSPQAGDYLGLRGPRNVAPDATGMGVQNSDCGFCHL